MLIMRTALNHQCRFISDDNCTTEQTSHNTNMCLFGGKCAQITNTESRCLCPSGISGQQCQWVQSVTFDGHGFIKLPPLPDLVMINNTVNISLTYSTSFEDGVIFFLSGVSSILKNTCNFISLLHIE